ncbi:acyl-CoA thioesterase [Actinomadura roseirufa]|uniref:acyl-CoA thioesterase n=1 Tax=Actinomadura roseirufa TaxID=2094049 RepID=UPI00104127F5|nr:thioesterase family protein [Actinomadura roseirufa]
MTAGTAAVVSSRIARFKVEHVDTDAAGVVHFSRYASWLESAVLDDMEDLGFGVGSLAEHGLAPAVMELSVRYVRPARFPDRIEVPVRVDHVGGASFRFAGEVRRDEARGDEGALLASGSLRLCLVSGTAAAPARIPAGLRARLRDRMEGAAR